MFIFINSMKVNILITCVIIGIFTISLQSKNSKNKKGMSKFERHYNSCKENFCKERKIDDNCIYKCIDSECYKEIFSEQNIYLEYGESDMRLRKLFENCYYKISK